MCGNIAHTSTVTGRSADRNRGGRPHVRHGAPGPDRRHRSSASAASRSPASPANSASRPRPSAATSTRSRSTVACAACTAAPSCSADHAIAEAVARRAARPRRDPEERDRPRGAALIPPTFRGSVLIDAGSTTGRLAELLADWSPDAPGARLDVSTNSIAARRRSTPRPTRTCAAHPRRNGPRHHRGRRRPVHHRPTQRHPPRPRLHRRQRRERRFGLSTPDEAEAAAKSAMVHAARRVVVLADSSKLDAESLVRFARLDEVDTLITDAPRRRRARRGPRRRRRAGGARMIVTLTANPSLDRTVELDGALAPGAVQRAIEHPAGSGRQGRQRHPGAARSGVDSVAVLPGRQPGDPFLAALARRGRAVRAVPIDGAVRTNLTIVDAARHDDQGQRARPRARRRRARRRLIDVTAEARDRRRLARARRIAAARRGRRLLRARRRGRRGRGRHGPAAPRIAADTSGAAARRARRLRRRHRPHQAERRGARRARSAPRDEAALEDGPDEAIALARSLPASACGRASSRSAPSAPRSSPRRRVVRARLPA